MIDRPQEIYGLHVAGLRKNTPRAAYGDNVMVRQLVMDPVTQLPMAAPASGSTGYQISAVVMGIDRPKEVLNLRINGFTPYLLMCNISFIVQTRWIKSLQRAVSSIAIQLKTSQQQHSPTDNQPTVDQASSPEHDFGPIGTAIKSLPISSGLDYFGPAKPPVKNSNASRKEYIGAIASSARAPRTECRDGLGFMGPPPWEANDSSRPTESEEPRSHLRNSIYNPRLDVAIQLTSQNWLRRMLFPEDADGVTQRSLPQGVFKRSWFDRHLNHEQKVRQSKGLVLSLYFLADRFAESC